MRLRAGHWLAIAGVALLVFSPALGGAFVLDDAVAVQGSSCVTGDASLGELWARNFWCEPDGAQTVDAWRPWPVLVWRLLWSMGGGSPLPFHALGMLLHALCAVLVAGIASLLVPEERAPAVALVSGLSFAVLPIHTEAVASVVGVAETWALALQLGAVALALRRDAWSWAALPLLALALLSKESSVVLGPLLLLLPWIGPTEDASPRPSRAAILRAVAAMLLVVAYLGLRVLVLGRITGEFVTATVNPLVGAPWGARLPMALNLLGRYLWLSVAGQPLSADYSVDAIPVHGTGAFGVLGLAALVGLVVVLVRFRDQPAVRVGALWFLGAYALASNLLALLPAMFAERLFYAPSAPLCLLLGVAVAPLVAPEQRLRRPTMALGSAILLVWGLLAALHAAAWRTEAAITLATVEACPDSARGRVWRARVLAREGAGEEMETQARAAIEILPDWAVPHALLGTSLDLQHRPEEALEAFRRALELGPEEGEVADLFVQFLLRYELVEQAHFVYGKHVSARDGEPDPRVTVPPPPRGGQP